MSWISRLNVRRAEGERYLLRRRPVPAIDPSYGDHRLAAVRAAAKEGGAGNWPGIRAHLAAAEDGEDLTFLVEGLGTVAGVERWIGDVAAADPRDALPLLVSGARHIAWAWHARPRLPVEQASAGQWKLFRTRLAVAEEHLFEAAAREPSWAAPWYFLQVSGRGSEAGEEAAGRRFEEVLRRAPGHLAAYRERLREHSRAGGGAQEPMHAFAREAMLAAPPGSPLGQLVALAHLEEWRETGADPDSVLMSRPHVVTALREAASRSVLHPAFVRRRDWALGFNAFAMAFALAGEYPAAHTVFRALGDRPTEVPWTYLDERSPLVPFYAWRDRVSR
ncbi:hypothetical protein [Streptomyces sp. HPF1205]|uniref:hypothetical protein n=1 Tax=Streptomyces sp. HPF1205 TaxID=2873262 RepID=UPI001CEDD43D|nr:hypothetical protein [Streptomyces sp. HPF1205]